MTQNLDHDFNLASCAFPALSRARRLVESLRDRAGTQSSGTGGLARSAAQSGLYPHFVLCAYRTGIEHVS
jgi:hypothetical protein